MPTAPQRPCRHPGCPTLIPSGSYCAQHQRPSAKAVYDQTKRKDDPRLAEAARIRSGAQWQKVRTIHRNEEPICCDPLELHPGQPRFSEHSHHIVPLIEDPAKAYDLDNLASLCSACHAEVERRERKGEQTRHLFAKCKARSA